MAHPPQRQHCAVTYAEATDFLFSSLPVWEQRGAAAYKPGLERIAAFLSILGNPQNRVRTIHVAGTNGKGSVSHMLAAVLQSAGLRTGLFTSPHLVDFRERIRVDGVQISEAAVVEFTERYKCDMVRLGLSFFEMATAMGLWWFSRSGVDIGRNAGSGLGVDIAVIEAGLGGRLDSTNIITPTLSIITNIALEHTQYLGDTIAKIATEKAGIIKPGVPAVIGETDPESAPVFCARAAELNSEILFADNQNSSPKSEPRSHFQFSIFNFQLDLHGDYQQKNLATVLTAIEILRRTLAIPDEALQTGLKNAAALTGLRGRWQEVGRHPLILLDTAHNAHGLAEVARQLARQNRRNIFMVIGFASDKDLTSILPLLPADARYIATRADTPRAMPPDELARRLNAHSLNTIAITDSVPTAIDLARTSATPDDMIFIGGSNFVVGEALPVFEKKS
ncbi:MAG: bifunctional folylpolyglutamate synthase/dihydrofolate synthase [Alistipes sp.]|jgi:dihydrofolate synthase/folylpolyglutamate synthase|nr:bifunctional folylpolyglutamate synthase/dihydrofolate synthase [Alistipes sp.]